MCFSATVSFGSGIILTATGVASVKKIQKKSQTFFAVIPFIFAVQQFAEGFLWLALKGKIDFSWQTTFTYLFIFIAQVVWPFWVPFSIARLEQNKKRKKVLFILTGLGSIVGLSVLYRMISYPVYAVIQEHHILYKLDFPVFIHYIGAGSYFAAIVFSSFISSVKRMKALGILVLFSFVVSTIFYSHYLISVWCFFAAIMSVMVYLVVRQMKLSNEEIHNYKISDYQF